MIAIITNSNQLISLIHGPLLTDHKSGIKRHSLITGGIFSDN